MLYHRIRDLDQLRDLKREYLRLVNTHGERVAELKSFRESLLKLNRRHRLEAIKAYASIISKIRKKVARQRSRRQVAK